jgi:hypothetical protein
LTGSYFIPGDPQDQLITRPGKLPRKLSHYKIRNIPTFYPPNSPKSFGGKFGAPASSSELKFLKINAECGKVPLPPSPLKICIELNSKGLKRAQFLPALLQFWTQLQQNPLGHVNSLPLEGLNFVTFKQSKCHSTILLKAFYCI